MAGNTVGPRISIQLNLETESHIDFMKTVDEDAARLKTIRGADGSQAAITVAGNFAAILQKIVPIVDDFASVSRSIFEYGTVSEYLGIQTHPIMKAAWIVLSSAYKVGAYDVIRSVLDI